LEQVIVTAANRDS